MAEGTRQGRHCHSLRSPEHGHKGGNFDIPETPPQPKVRSLLPSAISSSTAKAMKAFGSASWDGGVKDGRRRISTKSGALSGYPYGFGSRFEGNQAPVLMRPQLERRPYTRRTAISSRSRTGQLVVGTSRYGHVTWTRSHCN